MQATGDLQPEHEHPTSGAAGETPGRLARRILLGALVLGILADPMLRHGFWGLGLLVWMAAFAIIALLLMGRRRRPRIARESAVWLATTILFAAGLSWRDADALHFFNVLAMLVSLGLLAQSVSGFPVAGIGSARVRDLVRAALVVARDVVIGLVPLVLRDAKFHSQQSAALRSASVRVARAVALTIPIVLLFVILLNSADPVFGSYISLPEWDLEVAISHVLIAGFFGWIVAGWLWHVLLSPKSESDTMDFTVPVILGRTDVGFVLGALIVLFAGFVASQVGWLYGGERLVMDTTGLTYAEYARRGFFELCWVAALLLALLLGGHALLPRNGESTRSLFRMMARVLVLLLGAIMASAALRMQLYVHYYGISVDRLYASAFMAWLAVVFVWLMLTVLRSRPRLFATGLVTSGFAVLLALNVVNPDLLVARKNLARGFASTGDIAGADLPYLATLGGDAVPIVVAATTGNAPAVVPGPARCMAAARLLDRWSGERRDEMTKSWTEWNRARARAIASVRHAEAELHRITCADRSTDAQTPGNS